MSKAQVPRTAGIYVRISSDPTGRALGVARQEKACRERAEALGWRVAQVYTDNDVSASTGKRRPAYEQMLAALEAGTVNAVIVWDLDRLTRRPIEIEHFIDLADRKGIALASVGGDVDLATDNGRMFARIKGAVARAEVERKSARQKAANDQRADNGLPPAGRRAFGYTSDGLGLVEEEAAEFRAAADALLAGSSLSAIVRGMCTRGVGTTAGNAWKPTELRRVLVNPRHAGLRVHRGEVVGEGTWPAIIDVDTHRAVVAVLSDPSRHRAGRPRRYLLTRVARCGVCGGTIYGVMEPRGPLYYCQTRSHVARRAERIDEYVEGLVVARLSQPDAASLFAAPARQGDADALRAEERQLRARLDGLAEAYAVGEIDRLALAAGTRRLNTRLEVVTAELTSMLMIPTIVPLVGVDDVAEVWSSLEVEQRREIIGVLMDVTIEPAGRGARSFDPDTVGIMWR